MLNLRSLLLDFNFELRSLKSLLCSRECYQGNSKLAFWKHLFKLL